MPKPKQVCQFCEKKFKRVKGHYKFCKARNFPVQESTNTVALSPFARLIKAANEYWEQMSDLQKLRACAFISYTSDKGVI